MPGIAWSYDDEVAGFLDIVSVTHSPYERHFMSKIAELGLYQINPY